MGQGEKDDGPWTVARLLAWTRDHLQRQHIESPRLCAEILLAHAMRCDRINLYTRFECVPEDDVRGRFREFVRQAASGRPVAHLTGTKEFFSLTFEVTPDVLIPRPETEILVERTLDLIRKCGPPGARILDIGTGSGCIAISLARHLPAVSLFASDISEAALSVARRNAARNGVDGRVEWRVGDLFAPWETARPESQSADNAAVAPFDVIVSNPPYVATVGAPLEQRVRDFEPHVALFAGADGLDLIRRLASQAGEFLRPGGHLFLEIGFDQASAARRLFSANPWTEIAAFRDAAGRERVLRTRRV